MSSCREAVDCPAFHPVEGDCKTVNHDLKIEGGCLAGGDDAVSAALMQLTGEAPVDGQGGWWGQHYLDFDYGSRLHALDGRDLAAVDAAVRDAFSPLIAARLFDAVEISSVETLDGARIEVRAVSNGRALFETKLGPGNLTPPF